MRYLIIAALLSVSQLAFGAPVVPSTHTVTVPPPAPKVPAAVAVSTPSQPPVDVIQESLKKVVMIEVHGIIDDYESIFSTFTTKMPVAWYGSGSIISDDGMILSCNHLFIRKLEDRYIVVKLANGKRYMGLLFEQNNAFDLSLIKIFPLHKLPYFEFGSPVIRGQKVLAFGAPLEYEKTVSIGYVQNLDVELEKAKRTMHSASLNPGNSGGPLTTEDGKLVGVNVSILFSNFLMRAEGMGMAVTLKNVQEFLKD